MSRPLLLLLIGLLALALGWAAFFWEPAPQPGNGPQPAGLAEVPQGGDFSLHSWQGPLALEDLRGKVVALYFGYTHCPDVCPAGLSYLSGTLKLLEPEERERIQVLFIGVDPARDSPEHLREYVAYFHPDILGVTGSEAEVAEVARLYGAAYHRGEVTDSGYAVDHTTNIYLIDQQGDLRRTLPHGTEPAEIRDALRALLRPQAH